MSQPIYSIVIPTYNRELEVGRAIRSCLARITTDYEVIVVDDCSTDGSAEAVRPFLKDSRVALCRNETNQGEWGARAAGAAKAQGEWVVFLDSDDEILPGGLAAIDTAVRHYGEQFQRLGFGYLYDDGSESPFPEISKPTPLDLAGFLSWYSIVSRSDAMWVVHRKTFKEVPVPTGRWDHSLYAFDFHSAYRSLLVPVVAGAVHIDSANRLTSMAPPYNSGVRFRASQEAHNYERLLAKYGEETHRLAPRIHFQLLRAHLISSLVAGDRRVAFTQWKDLVRRHNSCNALALALLIVAGPTVAYWLREQHRRRKYARTNACAKGRVSVDQPRRTRPHDEDPR